jgi:CRP-like cAMP-binding protein
MAEDPVSAHLLCTLAEGAERLHKTRSTVLFRRGGKAVGMFVVLSGTVTLDAGVDSSFTRSCGPGALVGLPSTLTSQNYSMTATVTEDADLIHWTPEALNALLRKRPDICQVILEILGKRVAESSELQKTLNGISHDN